MKKQKKAETPDTLTDVVQIVKDLLERMPGHDPTVPFLHNAFLVYARTQLLAVVRLLGGDR